MYVVPSGTDTRVNLTTLIGFTDLDPGEGWVINEEYVNNASSIHLGKWLSASGSTIKGKQESNTNKEKFNYSGVLSKVTIPSTGLEIQYFAKDARGSGLVTDNLKDFLPEISSHSVVCDDYILNGAKLGSAGTKSIVNGTIVYGSDWDTTSPYSGYNYSSCSSTTVTSDTTVYRYFVCNHSGATETKTDKYGTCYGTNTHTHCNRCGANWNYTYGAVDHTWSTVTDKTGSCYGKNTHEVCSKNIHTKNYKYEAVDHTYGAYTYENSNGITNGYRYHECSNKVVSHRKDYQYGVWVNKGSGISSTSGTNWYASGSKVIIDATAKTGYTFSNWTGSFTTTTKNYTITNSIDKAYSITANATRNSYQLDVNPIRDGVKNNNGFGTGYTFNVDVTDNNAYDGYSTTNNTAYDASNVTDYCRSIPYGCTYKVTITNNPTGYIDSHPSNCSGTITTTTEATPTWTSTTHALDVNRRITINGTNHDYSSGAGTDTTPSGISYDSFKFNMTRKDRYGTALDSTSNATDYYNTAEKYGTTYVISAANTPAGYTWNGNYSGTVTGYTSQLIQWTANSYTITFKQNRPTNMTTSITGRADNSTVTVVFDSTTNNSVTTCNTDPNGWVFNGWYTAQTGGTKVYNADGSYNSSATSYWTSSGTWKYTGNITLYAQWTARQYTLYFNDSKPSNATHNVSLSPTSKVVTYDSKIGDVPTPTLKGWTLQKDSSGNHWFIGSTYINKDTIWNYTSSQTAYVSWKENEYNIYYEKGLTDDTTHQSIADATSNTNIQATGTSRPYTSAEYDNNVKIATIGSVLGRSYNVQFDSNKPASVTKQLTNNGDNPTVISDVTGNLPSRGTWQISGQDSDVTSNLTPAMGSTLTKPNYKDANNASLTATALWNNTNIKNFTDISMEGWTFLGWYDNQEGNNSTAVNNTDNTTVVNTSTDRSANSNVKVYGNITEYTVKPTTTKFDKTLYARWQRTITLTLNLNGGMYQNQDAPIVLTGIYYNNSDGYKFNLDGTLTSANLPDYEMQISSYKINGNQIGIDAYGTYDSNGVNNKYTKIDSNGATYRFLGWSTSPSATEPDSEYIVYKDNHKTSLRIYDSLNLYAVWEPVLTANVQVHRTLGDLTFSDGTTPKTSASGLHASDGLQQLQVIAKPGEQCGYTIQTLGSNNIYVGVEFDTKITDIYDHQGTWTDNLNPPTEEKIVENQTHGLNRILKLENNSATRKFFIPQYLGTDKSYSSSIGVKVYSADILIQQDSYYYKGLGSKEEIPVHITIYLTTDKSGKPKPTPTPDDPNPKDPDPVISVLDELRTKLKIRLK